MGKDLRGVAYALEGLLVYGTRVAGPHVVSGALAYP